MPENARINKTPLSTKQVQALPHLAIGQTLAHTATAINVSEKTLYRWLKDPVFKSVYLELRDLEAEIATAELRGLTLKAATVLSKAMDDPNPNISLRAAQTAVKTGVKANEAAEARRLTRLLARYVHEDDASASRPTSRMVRKQLDKASGPQ